MGGAIALDGGDPVTELAFEGAQTMSIASKVMGTDPKVTESPATLTLWHDAKAGAGIFERSFGTLTGRQDGSVVSCASPREITETGKVTGEWKLEVTASGQTVAMKFSGPVKCGRDKTGTITGWATLRRPKGWPP